MKVPGGRVFGAANAAEKHRSKVWNEQFQDLLLAHCFLEDPLPSKKPWYDSAL